MKTLLALLCLSVCAMANQNALILDIIQDMPKGGGYATNLASQNALASAIQANNGELIIRASTAKPSYCSGATYLVLLRLVEHLALDKKLTLPPDAIDALLMKRQADGKGIWGRWNANGPGTARLFYELELGPNFQELEKARAGDFLKIFWTEEIGKLERGHSVIFLGTETVDGKPHVRFWSSNQEAGYGAKSMPLTKCKILLFSRLENLENLVRASKLPATDPYLASMLTKSSSQSEMRAKCGIK